MEGLTTRAYGSADAAVVAELAGLVTRHVGGHHGASAEDVGAFLSSTVEDFGTDSRLVFTAEGERWGRRG